MKIFKLLRLLPVICIVLSGQAFAKPVSVSIARSDGNDFPGFATKADDSNIYISQFEDGSAAAGYAFSSMKGVSWGQPDDWKKAKEYWDRRDYTNAKTAFKQAMEDYKGFAGSKHPMMKDNIGAQAVFYYMECLRRTGKFADMMEPYVKVQKVNLGAKWQDQIKLFQGWEHVAKGRWRPLSFMMETYEVKKSKIPGIDDYTVAPNEMPLVDSLNFQHMAQVAYLRAISTEKLAEEKAQKLAELDPDAEATREERIVLNRDIGLMRGKALTDYARAYTINYGAERGLSLRSMLASLKLIEKMPQFKETYTMQKEAYGIATLFNVSNPGGLPTSLKHLLTEPVEPEADEN
jgi:tetratricopeptide (TPR) repeat protein